MGLTTLPTETDGSAGRDKSDRAPVPNLDEYIPAAEWNEIKRRVVELANAVGLRDGSTPDSIEARIGGSSTQAQSRYLDDFLSLADWTAAHSGTGTAAVIGADNANADGGLGVAEFATGAAAGTAELRSVRAFRGSLSYSAELHCKLPATPSTIGFSFGFDDGAGNSCKMGYAEGATVWTLIAESVVGGGSGGGATAVTVVGGAWQTLRAEWTAATQARFYVDDVLVGTVSTAGAVPRTVDDMEVRIRASRAAGPTASAFVDLVDVRGGRL